MVSRPAIAVLAALLAGNALYAARPVARWDVVPWQRVSGEFKAGVVAFHEKGVKVEFRVFGKLRHVAESPETNPRTGVEEYIYAFPAAAFRDGPVEIEATAVSPDGERYVLPPLPLYANARGGCASGAPVWADAACGNDFAAGTREAPVKTLRQAVRKAGDGGTVNLMPGEYGLKMIGGGTDRKYWTLVTPAPGVDGASVALTAGRTGTDKLHFRDVGIFCDITSGYGAAVMGESGRTSAWFENCRFANRKGPGAGAAAPFGNKLRAFVTGGSTDCMASGPQAEILRGHAMARIAGPAVRGGGCLVANCTVRNAGPAPGGLRPELVSLFATPPAWNRDTIVVGFLAKDCDCRALVCQQAADTAFSRVRFEGFPDGMAQCALSEGLENVLFDRVELPGRRWQWMSAKNGRGTVKPKDVVMKNCTAGSMEGCPALDGTAGVKAENCAIGNASADGSD